jgi:hypothetical protein
MTLRTPSVRLLHRATGALLLAGTVSVLGASGASAAEPTPAFESTVDAAVRAGAVEEVRADSVDSTKAVAGTAVLLVAGCITVVAARPRRRPPAEG